MCYYNCFYVNSFGRVVMYPLLSKWFPLPECISLFFTVAHLCLFTRVVCLLFNRRALRKTDCWLAANLLLLAFSQRLSFFPRSLFGFVLVNSLHRDQTKARSCIYRWTVPSRFWPRTLLNISWSMRYYQQNIVCWFVRCDCVSMANKITFHKLFFLSCYSVVYIVSGAYVYTSLILLACSVCDPVLSVRRAAF